MSEARIIYDFGIEQPHEYLASARGRECKLCLHDKDHPIHQKSVPDSLKVQQERSE